MGLFLFPLPAKFSPWLILLQPTMHKVVILIQELLLAGKNTRTIGTARQFWQVIKHWSCPGFAMKTPQLLHMIVKPNMWENANLYIVHGADCLSFCWVNPFCSDYWICSPGGGLCICYWHKCQRCKSKWAYWESFRYLFPASLYWNYSTYKNIANCTNGCHRSESAFALLKLIYFQLQ